MPCNLPVRCGFGVQWAVDVSISARPAAIRPQATGTLIVAMVRHSTVAEQYKHSWHQEVSGWKPLEYINMCVVFFISVIFASVYFIIFISVIWIGLQVDGSIYFIHIFVACRLTDLKWNRTTGVIEETWQRTSTMDVTDNKLDKQSKPKNEKVRKKPSASKSKANKAKPEPKGKGHWAWQRWKKNSPIWQRWKKNNILNFVQSSFAPLFAIEFRDWQFARTLWIWGAVQQFCWQFRPVRHAAIRPQAVERCLCDRCNGSAQHCLWAVQAQLEPRSVWMEAPWID